MFWSCNYWSSGSLSPHSTLLQAEEKRVRNPVPKCPSKLLEPAIGRTVSQIRKKSAFWFWAKILGQNNEGILPHTFLSSQTKNGEKFFFSFFTLKMCNFFPAQLTSNWSVGMKIMQLILCYCGQRSANFLWKVLEAPSSFEIFNFLTVRDRKLKFWQNDALMSTLFCQNFSLLSVMVKKLKISKLDGAKSTLHKKFSDHRQH